MNRVVITGLGVISAAGHNAADFWNRVSKGQPSIGPITTIPTDTLNVEIGAEVAGFEPADYFDKRQLGMLDRFSQFGLVAAREAVSDSGISFDGEAGERAAAIIGFGCRRPNHARQKLLCDLRGEKDARTSVHRAASYDKCRDQPYHYGTWNYRACVYCRKRLLFR